VKADDSLPLPESFPFCGRRCRLLDLGKWFDEEYRVARPLDPGEVPEPPALE
jgi:endogenous inhibitor of DNA gyrase (YacG/DUF329 family)